jgi:hypothetical protein
MSETTFPDPPWCNGRIYPNGPAESKVWCEERPPPWFWWMTGSGFTVHYNWMNDQRRGRVWRVFHGMNPLVEWRWEFVQVPFGAINLQWQASSTPFSSRQLNFTVQDGFPPDQIAVWRMSPVPVVSNWFALDNIDLPMVSHSPSWQGGEDAVINLKVGTYDLIPAMECAQWPPP